MLLYHASLLIANLHSKHFLIEKNMRKTVLCVHGLHGWAGDGKMTCLKNMVYLDFFGRMVLQ